MNYINQLETQALEIHHNGIRPGELCVASLIRTYELENSPFPSNESLRACFVHKNQENIAIETVLNSIIPIVNSDNSESFKVGIVESNSYLGAPLTEAIVDFPDVEKLFSQEIGGWFIKQHPSAFSIYSLTANAWGPVAENDNLIKDMPSESTPVWYCMTIDTINWNYQLASINAMNSQVLMLNTGILSPTFVTPGLSWYQWGKIAIAIAALVSIAITVAAALPALAGLSIGAICLEITLALTTLAVAAGVIRGLCGFYAMLISFLMQQNARNNASNSALRSQRHASLNAIEKKVLALEKAMNALPESQTVNAIDLQNFRSITTEVITNVKQVKTDAQTSSDLDADEKKAFELKAKDILEGLTELEKIGQTP